MFKLARDTKLRSWSAVLGSLMLAVAASFAVPLQAAEEAEKAPARVLPKMVKLHIFPAELTLSAERDIRRVIVTGTAEDGLTFDLSAGAKLSLAGNNAEARCRRFCRSPAAGTNGTHRQVRRTSKPASP